MPQPGRNLRTRPSVTTPMNMRLALAATIALVAAACTPGGGPTSATTILPGPTGGATLNAGELRLLLMDRLGALWYCGDDYPVARGTEQERAIERYAEMVAEGETFRAVTARLGIDPDAAHSDADKLAIYHLWRPALAFQLDPIGEGVFRFDYLAQPVGGVAEGTRTAGVVRDTGEITIEQQARAGEPMCPICLARGTLIDTPAGAVPVERLHLGDPIWTRSADGRRVAGVVIALGSTAAPPDHEVVRLVLEDGRSVTASPGHPLADGRLIGDLRQGDEVDGSRIAIAVREPYASTETFDLVSSGETGLYFAGGIPLGSTLVPR